MKIKVIMGSTREGRFGEHPAKWIFELARKKKEFDAELLDLRNYPMPFFNDPVSPAYRQGGHSDSIVAKWEKKIAEADGFIVVSPEYNHGYPAVLKNAFDYVYHAWNQKPIGFVSYGSVGGARAVEQLRLVAVELQMAPIRNAAYIAGGPWNMLEKNGSLKTGALEPFAESAENLLNQLIWWVRALKTARQDS